ncbi:MBG domain-containing protein [Pseudooceanicola sp.]|uniref:MBG domain-containing protein n=1 Tax=Pseudooceanicola sp. TaxID=1914328 RepID=UPI003519C8FA
MKSGSAFPAPSVSDPRPRGRRALLAALLGGVALPGALLADPLPTGGTVASGTVGIATPGAQSMVITQGSDRAVVNWDSFSIGSGAHVDIRQPDAGSALLNRVTGDTTSAIHGRLTANGQVHLVNPNGIFIGANGKIDAGSFVASTLNITDDDFLAGRLRYGGTGASGTVRNAGRVTVVPGGYAAFLGGRVRNEGVVTVPMGRIGFASGERVTLDLSGDQFLQVAIPTGGDDDGKALVENSGTASAEGGLIEMRAATAREAVRHAVNLSGVAEARSVSVRNGVITLGGGAGGRVTVSGRATTAAAAPTGAVLTSARPRARPEVRITGAHIDLAGARIDASGAGGGGLIRIGGDFAGAGALPRAETLTADATTEIRADAIGTGDGGRIALWSDLRSDVAARLSARGGDNGGDGGFIEVSSARTLSYSGLADTRAPMGAWGTLLLDPQDIVINPGAGGEDTLEANLESGNVSLDTFEPSVPDAGDITINANIDWMAETTLTLDADNDIFLNGAINGPNGGFSLFAAGSITPAAAVNVDDFRLFNGSWSQLGTLPAFDVDSFSLSSGATFLRALGGDGGTSPYRLTDIYGVQGVGTLPGDNFVLANDIDASGTLFWSNFDGLGFAPIQSFDAVFDGDQHRISGLYSESGFEGLNNTAMFYNIGSNATVRDLTLSDVEIVGRGAAALAYINNGLIENTRVSGTVTSEGYVTGGLVAINNGTIEDTAISVDVTATHVSDGEVNTVGGFVGSSSGSIARSNTTGSVTVVNSAGAISLDVGGFAGRGDGITDSYSWADVDVSGGGDPDATIAVGGFIGTVTGPVTRSYSTGAVTTSGNATFSTGGFAGRDLSSGGTANNLWDVQSSGQATSAVGTGLSTAQLQDTEAFFGLAAMAGGDFLQVWAPGDTGFYPVNYSTSPVILASPDALSVQYGLTGDASATGTTFGGPDPYVFDAPSDSIDPADLAAIFDDLTFASTDAGTTTFTLDTTSVTSAGGVTHRVIDRIGAAEITPAPLTITPDDVTKTYGQSVTLDGFSTSTLYFSDSVDDVTLTSDGTAGSAPVVGSPYDINASDATGTGLENYTITYATGDLTVTPAPLTISANDQTKTYGTAFDFDGNEFTATGLLFADRIETLGLASDGAAADAPVAGAPYEIEAFEASGSGLDNYTITYVSGAMTVLRAPLTITADNQTKTYGDTFSFDGTEFTATGLLFSDRIETLGLASDGAAADAPVAGEPYEIEAFEASGSGLDNYTITYVSGAMTVLRAPLTITADNQIKTYGDTFLFDGTEFTTAGLLFSDSIDSVGLSSAGAVNTATVAGGPYAINASDASGNGAGNYAITYVPGTMTVGRAPLTITADNQIKTYGDTFLFDGTEFTTAGLRFPTDTVTALDLSSDGAAAEATTEGSPYAITGSGPVGSGLENYDISIVDGELFVTETAADLPPPPPPGPGGLPNPNDTIDISFGVGSDGGGSVTGGGSGAVAQASRALARTRDFAEALEFKAEACGQGSGDVTRYLACMSDAMNDFSNELDSISSDLPPAMQNVARIVDAAKAGVDRARTRAVQRLAGATTEAEREAIRRDAWTEAETAMTSAASEIRKTIALVRVEDPELASIQQAQITTVADAMDSVAITLSRVADL